MKVGANLLRCSPLPKFMLRVLRGGTELIGSTDALPFAYFGAVLGGAIINGSLPTLSQWVWITLAMVGARSAAMSLNRVIDAQIDKMNPRTEERAIPAGLISKLEVIVFIIASFALLFVSAFQLNMLAVYLLPVAVFFLVIYSYTKRFTWLCHVILGVTIAIAPLSIDARICSC